MSGEHLMSTAPATRDDHAVARRTPGPVIAWRAVIAGLAWWGLFGALHGDVNQLLYFSQLTTLTIALTATASVIGFALVSERWQRAIAWCRGASTTYAIITALIYQVLLSGSLQATSSLLEHAIVPALALIDWVLFGPGRHGQPWWTPLSWLILPICYLAVYRGARNSSGRPLYPFLNPEAPTFWPEVAKMAVVFVAVGFLVWGLGLLQARLARSRMSRSTAVRRAEPGR